MIMHVCIHIVWGSCQHLCIGDPWATAFSWLVLTFTSLDFCVSSPNLVPVLGLQAFHRNHSIFALSVKNSCLTANSWNVHSVVDIMDPAEIVSQQLGGQRERLIRLCMNSPDTVSLWGNCNKLTR